MSEDIALPFELPSVARKKVSVGFDGGRLSSDAGVLLLRGVERKLGLAGRTLSHAALSPRLESLLATSNPQN
jgi:hypothetical protein